MNAFRSLAYFYCAAILAVSAVEADPVLKNGELLEKTGITRQVMHIPALLQQSVREFHRLEGTPVDAGAVKAWDNSVLIAFKPEKILAPLDEGIEKLLTPEEKSELLAFYNSPLGKKITEMSMVAEPEALAKIGALAQNPASFADRAALYKELDDATGATPAAINLETGMWGALLDGLRAGAKGPARIAIDTIAAKEKDALADSTQQASARVAATFAFCLKDLSADELKAYIKAVKTPAGRKFYRGLNDIMSDALTARSEEFGRLLHKTLNAGRPD